jgi:hypothetical protein
MKSRNADPYSSAPPPTALHSNRAWHPPVWQVSAINTIFDSCWRTLSFQACGAAGTLQIHEQTQHIPQPDQVPRDPCVFVALRAPAAKRIQIGGRHGARTQPEQPADRALANALGHGIGRTVRRTCIWNPHVTPCPGETGHACAMPKTASGTRVDREWWTTD